MMPKLLQLTLSGMVQPPLSRITTGRIIMLDLLACVICERNSVFACWGWGFAIVRLCNIEAGAKLLRERNKGFEIP